MVLIFRVLTLSVVLAASAVFAGGCNGISAGDDRMPDAAPTVTSPDSPDASETGPPDVAPASDTVAATPALSYQGSPLCNASRSTGCCYPDDPTNAQACAQAACQSAPDAGPSEASGAYIDVALGCHVVPAPPSPQASPGSAATIPACLPGGAGLDGFPCAGPTDCAPSYECVGTTPTCRHYCCNGNDSCHDLQFCDIQPTFAWPETKVPACMPVQQCMLLEILQCPAAETCAVVRDDGTTSCVAIGSAGAGQSCETDHCAGGLVCLGTPGTRSCYVLCQTGNAKDCAGPEKCQGGLPLFPDPGVGICQ
jgi:hypothetical protein